MARTGGGRGPELQKEPGAQNLRWRLVCGSASGPNSAGGEIDYFRIWHPRLLGRTGSEDDHDLSFQGATGHAAMVTTPRLSNVTTSSC